MMTHQEDILLCLALLAPVSCWWITSGLSWVTCMVAWQSRLGKGAALQEAATPQIKAATEKSMDSFNRSTSQMVSTGACWGGGAGNGGRGLTHCGRQLVLGWCTWDDHLQWSDALSVRCAAERVAAGSCEYQGMGF
eukprot:357241-Chlamydomonas_euryale.AAC.22